MVVHTILYYLTAISIKDSLNMNSSINLQIHFIILLCQLDIMKVKPNKQTLTASCFISETAFIFE